MKKMAMTIMLTVMLKIWWPAFSIDDDNTPAGSGIVSSWVLVGWQKVAITITKDKMFLIPMTEIKTWKWVNVEAEQ